MSNEPKNQTNGKQFRNHFSTTQNTNIFHNLVSHHNYKTAADMKSMQWQCRVGQQACRQQQAAGMSYVVWVTVESEYRQKLFFVICQESHVTKLKKCKKSGKHAILLTQIYRKTRNCVYILNFYSNNYKMNTLELKLVSTTMITSITTT